MSLLDTAAADLRSILGDAVSGFAVPITITSPAGVVVVVNGQQRDISLSLDPQTGVMVAGRTASVALSTSALLAAGISIPQGEQDSGNKPWIVQFTAPTGGAQVFKVSERMPDTLGCVVLQLEAYDP